MDVKISELPSISAVQLDGSENFFLQKANDNFKISVEQIALYAMTAVGVSDTWVEGQVRYRVLTSNVGLPYDSEGNIRLTLMGNAMAKAEQYVSGSWDVIGENLLI